MDLDLIPQERIYVTTIETSSLECVPKRSVLGLVANVSLYSRYSEIIYNAMVIFVQAKKEVAIFET